MKTAFFSEKHGFNFSDWIPNVQKCVTFVELEKCYKTNITCKRLRQSRERALQNEMLFCKIEKKMYGYG